MLLFLFLPDNLKLNVRLDESKDVSRAESDF